eukprot:1249273-Rhodomonas_salina.1
MAVAFFIISHVPYRVTAVTKGATDSELQARLDQLLAENSCIKEEQDGATQRARLFKEERDVLKEERDVIKEERDVFKEELDVFKEERDVFKEERD